MSFTHLHVSTAFSAHYGVSWPDELAAAAAADGATALACTDRDGLYGTVKHLKACMAAGLDPIVGVDLAVFDDDGDLRTQVGGRVVVLAHGHNNGAGYRALCRLISDAHARTTGKAGGAVPVAVTRAELASRTLHPETLKPVLTVLIGPGLRRRTCHGRAGATCAPAPCSNAGSTPCRPEPSPPRWSASSARPGNRSAPPTRCGCSSSPPNTGFPPC